jgi:glycosyltransferase involved in cell wall biosynthesis
MSSKNIPGVSALVLTYNNAGTVIRCLESISAQRTSAISEIIIWDNNSTDGTVQKILEFREHCPIKIVLQLNEENLYLQGSGFVLDAINLCKNPFIAIVDGDDEWILDSKTDVQLESLVANPKVNVVCTRAEFFDVRNKYVTNTYPDEMFAGIKDPLDLAKENFICNSTVMFRKSMVENLSSDYNFMPIKDYPLWVWGSSDSSILVLKDVSTRYNYNHGSNVSEKKSKVDRLFDVIFTKIAIGRRIVDSKQRETWLSEVGNDINYFMSRTSLANQLVNERDQLVNERDHLVNERDQLVNERDQLVNERDQLVNERDQILSSRFVRLWMRLIFNK